MKSFEERKTEVMRRSRERIRTRKRVRSLCATCGTLAVCTVLGVALFKPAPAVVPEDGTIATYATLMRPEDIGENESNIYGNANGVVGGTDSDTDGNRDTADEPDFTGSITEQVDISQLMLTYIDCIQAGQTRRTADSDACRRMYDTLTRAQLAAEEVTVTKPTVNASAETDPAEDEPTVETTADNAVSIILCFGADDLREWRLCDDLLTDMRDGRTYRLSDTHLQQLKDAFAIE